MSHLIQVGTHGRLQQGGGGYGIATYMESIRSILRQVTEHQPVELDKITFIRLVCNHFENHSKLAFSCFDAIY